MTMNIPAAAKLLGVSTRQIYRYIKSGRLPATPGRYGLMVDKESVQRLKEGQ